MPNETVNDGEIVALSERRSAVLHPPEPRLQADSDSVLRVRCADQGRT
jgi:hypothetical protein